MLTMVGAGRQLEGNATTSRAWWLPFIVVVLAPIVAGAATTLLFPDARQPEEIGLPRNDNCDDWFSTCYEYYPVNATARAALIPAVLYLAPFGWILSSDRRGRAAGITAGVLGLLQIAAVGSVLLMFDRVTSPNGGSFFSHDTGFLTFPPMWVFWMAGVLVALLSAAVWMAFGMLIHQVPWPAVLVPLIPFVFGNDPLAGVIILAAFLLWVASAIIRGGKAQPPRGPPDVASGSPPTGPIKTAGPPRQGAA